MPTAPIPDGPGMYRSTGVHVVVFHAHLQRTWRKYLYQLQPREIVSFIQKHCGPVAAVDLITDHRLAIRNVGAKKALKTKKSHTAEALRAEIVAWVDSGAQLVYSLGEAHLLPQLKTILQRVRGGTLVLVGDAEVDAILAALKINGLEVIVFSPAPDTEFTKSVCAQQTLSLRNVAQRPGFYPAPEPALQQKPQLTGRLFLQTCYNALKRSLHSPRKLKKQDQALIQEWCIIQGQLVPITTRRITPKDLRTLFERRDHRECAQEYARRGVSVSDIEAFEKSVAKLFGVDWPARSASRLVSTRAFVPQTEDEPAVA